MEFTKKSLDEAKFRSRGKWYDGREVDAFLEELAVAADEKDRALQEARQENAAWKSRADAARQEAERLRQELEAARSSLPPNPLSASCLQLERERDSLIQDIKALRRFRETFRQAVTREAGSLLEQAESLPSEKLL